MAVPSKCLIRLFPIALVAAASSVAAVAGPPTYRVTEIHGAGAVRAVRPAQPSSKPVARPIALGDELRIGDVLVTSGGQTVIIRAEDDSTLALTENTALEIGESHGAVHAVTLRRGKVIGNVKKPEQRADGESKDPLDHNAPRYKFLLRTRTAVMGVRGTQFIVSAEDLPESDADGAGAEPRQVSRFYVLEGVVDVASDLKSLMTDNVVVATTGQLVASAGDQLGVAASQVKGVTHGVVDTVTSGVQTLSKAMPFDVLALVTDLNQHLPEMMHVPLITGEERVYTPHESRFHLTSFELFDQAYWSAAPIPADGDSWGLGLAWTPTAHLVPGHLDLRGVIANSRLFQEGHGLLGDLEAKVLLTAIVRAAALFELGPIVRHYRAVGTGYGVATNVGVWFGDRRLLHLIDRFFFGTNWVSVPDRGMEWEYRFGAGFTIF